jgi:hypothetical protein
VVVEDAHWADPPTLELLGRWSRLRSSRSLLVGCRPNSIYLGRPRTPLCCGSRQSRERHGLRLPAAAPDQVLSDRGAHRQRPLFVEEMTKAVLRSDLLAETADSYGASPADTVRDPASFTGPMARLDRWRRSGVAQLAATLGRTLASSCSRRLSMSAPSRTRCCSRDSGAVYRRG